ncbi:MAG: hypothetical protein M3O64_02190 [Chloroflexota bacterium]|nr:hypothetical protein [Chloroflexota bacterium]
MASVLAMCLLMIGALAYGSAPASAAPLGAPVNQCNNDAASNVGGQGLSCTVTIVNYVTASGGIDTTTPSTVTLTRCVGAAGPIGAGAGTCTTTTSISAAPVLSVTQCDGVSNGGGGVLICTVTMTNYFSGAPAGAPTPATVYQCIGSVITGPGAPGTCTPVNTPGVTSVTAANVGQCNGSGNGGTNVGFICTVATGSTASSTLPVNIDQCNGSTNGGGSLTTCRATINSVITAATASASPTPSATPVATATPGAATPAPTGAPTARPSAPVSGLPSTSTVTDQTAPLAFAGLVLVLIGGLVLRARRITPPIR